MAGERHFDLIVIGSGSAASAGWMQAVQMDKRVAVFEDGVLGGECPTFACVPTKALLQCAEVYRSAQAAGDFGITTGEVGFDYRRVKQRKDLVVSRTGAAEGEQPYRDAGIHLVRERARFVAPDAVEAGGERYTADRFLIATGSSDVIPPIDGLDEAGCITFKEAIDLTAPPESIFILGGGPVGCEFAEVFSSFGSQVTIADQLPRLLPNEDPEIGHLLTHHFLQRGVTVLTETTASRFERDGDRKRVTVKTPDGEDRITVDEVLVAVGRKPNTDVGLEEAGVEYDKGGVKVDGTLRTSNPRVYAAGDVAGPYRFTHAASYQGGIAVYNAFSDETVEVDYSAMPRCVYTSPEVATVGLTEEQARERFDPVYVGIAELGTLGRANTSEEFEGFVKVIADGERRLVGAAIVAPPAGEMIHELALAIRLGATADHVASTVHAFPTFSEAIPEACGSLEPAQHRREG